MISLGEDNCFMWFEMKNDRSDEYRTDKDLTKHSSSQVLWSRHQLLEPVRTIIIDPL